MHHTFYFLDSATLCDTLQHATAHCNTLQQCREYNAVAIASTLQHIATTYSTLQHTATHCNRTVNALQLPSLRHCNTLQHTVTHCNSAMNASQCLSSRVWGCTIAEWHVCLCVCVCMCVYVCVCTYVYLCVITTSRLKCYLTKIPSSTV